MPKNIKVFRRRLQESRMKDKHKINRHRRNDLTEPDPPHGREYEEKRIIEVSTGKVEAAKGDTVLESRAIGSCVVIAAYDSRQKIGALAHTMVPGFPPKGRAYQRTKYAGRAIEEMIDRMIRLGADKDGIEACLVGGANVLQNKEDSISQENVASTVDLLHKKHIKIRAKAVGGTKRRSVSLYVKKGNVHYTEGEREEKVLWKTKKK